ncbi:MAG: hypothetical protein IJO68_08595 [Clostridia bacterium]|nr:hypothetical protein [Clostridia bacterium]MBQ9946565.1 hypothetical protein [Clostridia bacterium]
MADKIKSLLTEEVSAENAVLLLGIVVGILIALFLFYKVVKACIRIENQSGIAAHSVIKTAIVAIVPAVYGVLAMFNVEIDVFPKKYVVVSAVIGCIAVIIWNLISFGPIYGILFSIMHIGFGAIASLGVWTLAFIIVFAVAVFLFGGAAMNNTASGGMPSALIDPSTGQIYDVVKGANGEYYVNRDGSSLMLRNSDFNGTYIDGNGNYYKAVDD